MEIGKLRIFKAERQKAMQKPKNDQVKRILEKYETLLRDVDKNCTEVFASAPEIPCKNKCVDCCRQLFPVSFVEAFYISEKAKELDRAARRTLAKNAEKISKKILAADPLRFEQRGVDRRTALATHAKFASFLHSTAADCPALDESGRNGACAIYPWRNHDCRVMGYSFDFASRETIGCQRFNTLKHLLPKLMPFNYKYDEKMALDEELISAATNGKILRGVFYFTTMCTALIKNFAAADWSVFFSKKGLADPPLAKTPEENEYWVVVDI